jgi:CHAD domain-containing protein
MIPAGRKAAEAAIEAVFVRVNALRAQTPLVYAGDVEGLHDMRVASRRLRAALAEFEPLFRKGARAALNRRAARVTRLLGRARELDVDLALLEKFASETGNGGLPAYAFAVERLGELRRAEAEHCEEAAALAESPGLDREVAALAASVRRGDGEFIQRVPTRLNERFNSLCTQHDDWKAENTEERLHRVRIAFKKFRYACELFQPFYGGEMKLFIRQLKQVQDHLGDWNDCRVLAHELEAALQGAPRTGRKDLKALVELLRARKTGYFEEFRFAASNYFTVESRERIRAFLHETRD